MPTYEYACTACGHQMEAVQSFSDDPLTVCPECDGSLRKVYAPVGIVLKGSGFYKTDSRAAANGSAAKKSEGASSGSGGETSTSSKESASASGGDGGRDATKGSDSGKGKSKDTAPAATSAS